MGLGPSVDMFGTAPVVGISAVVGTVVVVDMVAGSWRGWNRSLHSGCFLEKFHCLRSRR